MVRTLCLACSYFLALASPSAAAAEQRPRRYDVTQRQAQIREVLGTFDLVLSGDQVTLGPRGRRDLVLFSPRAMDPTVAAIKDAYRESRTLLHGFRVAGWARVIATGGYTFTLKDESEGSWVIELADAGLGCRVVIWGLGRTWLPERRPLAVLPIRLIDPE